MYVVEIRTLAGLAAQGLAPSSCARDPLTRGLDPGATVLSHVWSSGQDQVAIIKRKLQLQLRGARIFLDVDDLDEIDKLEEYVNAAQCFLVFLSKGYFFSKNCLRELDSASACGVMPVLVHEISVDHGGTSLETLRADCVSQKRDADSLFDGNKIVPWHRLADFQHLSLQKIAEEMLFSHSFLLRRPLRRSYPERP